MLNWDVLRLSFKASICSFCTVLFANREVACGLNAPVYDLDGVTPVVGDDYVVELWAGPSAATMRPIATTGFRASGGYFGPGFQPVSIPTVEAGSVAHVQERVWDTQGSVAARYEEAEQRNLKRGVSSVFTGVAGNEGTPPTLPACLLGLPELLDPTANGQPQRFYRVLTTAE